MEKIVCYFDVQTLIKFKSLSTYYNDFALNALRYNKLFEKMCRTEIPSKYFTNLLSKYYEEKSSSNGFSEKEYETVYKTWLRWQSSVFNVIQIAKHNFVGYNKISKIFCYQHDVMAVFERFTVTLSLSKIENTAKFLVKKHGMNPKLPDRPLLRNPWERTSNYICLNLSHSNICPSDCPAYYVHHSNNKNGKPTGKLIDVDMNMLTNVCCYVRESCYEWHSHNVPNIINGHYCKKINNTVYTSVVYGVIVSLGPENCIVVHDIYNNLCTTLHSWLDLKYIKGTAFYIYTNILFVGTKNSYLLAYRLKCWDDLIHLKKENMLFETKLQIGQIKAIGVVDYQNINAIVVASVLNMCWLKVN